MMNLSKATLVALGMAIFGTAIPSTSTAESNWITSKSLAIATARSTGKPILVYVSTDWCAHCKSMDRGTWSDSDVARYVDTNYSALYLDGDSHPDLAERYRLNGYPALLIFAASGEYLSQRTGYIDREQMLIWLGLFSDERMEPLTALPIR